MTRDNTDQKQFPSASSVPLCCKGFGFCSDPRISAVRFSEFFRRNSLRSHVLAQRFRNHHAAVGLLIVFQNRQPRPSDGQPAAVQRVYVLALFAALRAITYVGPPRLVGLKV